MQNSDTPKVSLLVPICNVERYLRECLDSAVAQTLKDIEIICINDGSTDSSPDIIREYMERDPRVKMIDKANSGYGDSMNRGLEMARGAGLVFSSGRPIINLSDEYNSIGGGYFLGIPIPIFLFVGVLLAGIFLLRFARFGRHVYAVGGNEQASKLSGLNTGRIKIAVYGLSGLFSGFAGVLLSSRVMTGSPVAGVGYELDAIAAVVVGGASLAGGRGTVLNTLIGVMILSIISNVMNLMNIPGYHQQVVKGAIIIMAVMLESLKGRFNSRS